tara:strand:+ start:93 stop:371 length:279 start_codon:yes stop_codon:yes gene_type:complete
MSKETLDEKILALRTAVLSNLLRKKKIKHSVPDLEKMVINKSDLSVYNYFSSRKNVKKRLIIYVLSITIVSIASYIIYTYWPLTNLKDLIIK